MGGSESGYLALQVDSPTIQAGNDITGTIHFHVQTLTSAEFLILKLSGKEHAYWEERTHTTHGGHRRTHTHSYTGHSSVFKQEYPLFSFQNAQVAPGDYSFPFRLGTPVSLPGTFEYHGGLDSAMAYIRYRLTAYVRPSNRHVRKAKLGISITSRLNQAIASSQDLVAAEISTWCCRKKGRVQFGVNINKTAYVPGEHAFVHVDVDNSQSMLDAKGVQATLYRMIRLRSNGMHRHLIKQVVNRGYTPTLVPAGQTATGTNGLQAALPVQDSSGTIQNTTTVRARHVECIYALDVQAEMDGNCMCCGQKPKVSREVTIYPLQQVAVELPTVPMGWSPAVMPVVQFAAPLEYQYEPSAPPMPATEESQFSVKAV